MFLSFRIFECCGSRGDRGAGEEGVRVSEFLICMFFKVFDWVPWGSEGRGGGRGRKTLENRV